MLVSSFYRMVGGWVYTIKAFQAHFLNLCEPALTTTPMDRNPQVAPIYRTQSSHHTSSIGWGSQLNWKWGLEWNTIYCTDNIVRNLLCWLMKMGACKSRSLPRYGTQLWNHLEITYVLYYGKGPFPPRNTFDLSLDIVLFPQVERWVLQDLFQRSPISTYEQQAWNFAKMWI
jgi:hypothetical protein